MRGISKVKLSAVLKLIHLIKDEFISIPKHEETTAEESLKEKEAFSVGDSNFFSLPPEHLGRTSANELDEIIAKEALGCK
ncbi:hypothetical protein KKG61_04985 [bacterium]|nr:hypothetical protein [bacterium]